MAALSADENVDRRVFAELRPLGHDVLTTREAGRAGRKVPESDQPAFATAAGLAIVTNNYWEYQMLRRSGPGHAGIVTSTHDSDAIALARRMHAAVSVLPSLLCQLVRSAGRRGRKGAC